MESFTIETRITEAAYIRLMLRLAMRQRRSLRIMLIALCVIAPLAIIAQLVAPAASTKEALSAILPVLILIPLVLVLRAALMRNLRKAYQNSPALQHSITYTFEDTQISNQGAGFEGRISWSNIVRKEQAGEWLLLYTSSATAIILSTKDMTPDQLSFIASKTGTIPKK
jgi:hypothetical protein